MADDGGVPFVRFVESLSDFKFVALDAAIDRVLARRGLDLVRTEWLKALGGGLHEFRVRHTAREIAQMFGGAGPSSASSHERVLLRVFVHFYGDRMVLLLGGYDKGRHSGAKKQQQEIARARRSLAQFKARGRRAAR